MGLRSGTAFNNSAKFEASWCRRGGIGTDRRAYDDAAYGAANAALTKTAAGFSNKTNPYRYYTWKRLIFCPRLCQSSTTMNGKLMLIEHWANE